MVVLVLSNHCTLPMPLKVLMMFINGLPLGMVFGLVMGYLEGRRQTEALSAMLCASFIVSSGFVKTVGRILVDDYGVSEFSMPMVTGMAKKRPSAEVAGSLAGEAPSMPKPNVPAPVAFVRRSCSSRATGNCRFSPGRAC